MQRPTVSPPANPTARVIRAALSGLAVGLALGALYLLSLSAAAPPSCAGLSKDECALEARSHAELARLQRLGAVGLSCGALGLALYLRSSRITAPSG